MKKIILSAAFVAVGTFAIAQQNMGNMQRKDPAQMEQKRAENMKQMQSDLNLTSAQMAQIKALHDKKMADRKANAPQMQADRKAKMDRMKSNQEEWNGEMKKILTPDQYKTWEAKKQEKMQNKRNNMQQRKMKNMPAQN